MEQTEKFISALNLDHPITIIPEDATQRIIVSKTILCQTSNYFVTALDGEFKEAQERTLRMPGWNVDTIKLFIFWAYKQGLPDFKHKINSDDAEDLKLDLIRLWLFGDAHLIPRLQNAAMAELIHLTAHHHTEVEVIKLGYEKASKDSALYKFVFDQARYEYFGSKAEHGLKEGQLRDLFNIPGFQSDFLMPVRRYIESGGEVHNETYLSAHENGLDEYKVKEV